MNLLQFYIGPISIGRRIYRQPPCAKGGRGGDMLLEKTAVEGGLDPRSAITDAEVAAYKENGFVLPKVGLPEGDTAWMRERIERIIVDNPDWHGILRMPHVPLRPGQLEGLIGGEDLFKIALHPTVIQAARRLVGPNLIMWGGEIFAKPPG